MRKHPVAVAAIATGAVAVVFVVGAVVDLMRIKADVEGGSTTLAELSLEGLGEGLVETVGGAASQLVHADEVADSSFFLGSLGALPLIGDQIGAVRDLTDAGAELGSSVEEAALAIDQDLQRASGEPAARLDLLETLGDQLDRIEQVATTMDIGAEGWLVPPLRDAREQVVEEIDDLPQRFDEARAHLDALHALLSGPSRYLVLAANNAEMRGGAGMPLSGGVVTFQDGDVSFGEFESLANRHVPGVGDLVPEEYDQTYFNFKMGRSWLQTAVSPNFTTIGPIYSAMSAQFPLGPVDGVIEVDVVALRHLLSAIGPVELDGFTYTEENIEAEILNENYLALTDASQEERARRQDLQGRLANKIFEELKGRDVELAQLALELQEAARGRHLMAWSSDPGVQGLWESVGATGALDPIGLMVTVQNIAANKLDWYIDPKVTIRTEQRPDSGAWDVTLTVTIENPERGRTSPAVESFRPEPIYRDGMHRALVAIYLPEAAFDIYSLDTALSEYGYDPPMQMVGRRVFIPEGQTATLDLAFSMPEEDVAALILPSGRVRPVHYNVNGIPVTDASTTLILWSPPGESETRPMAPGVAAVLAVVGAGSLLLGTRARLRLVRGRLPQDPFVEVLHRAPMVGLALLGAALAVLAIGAAVSAVA